MILGFETDTHFRGKDLEIQLEGYRAIREDMKSCGVEWVLHAGDFVDRPAIQDRYAPAGKIIDGVKRVVHDAGLPTLIARGNHDGDSGLQAFDRDRLLVPVYRPRMVRIGPGVVVGVVPWMFPRDGDPEELKSSIVSTFRDAWSSPGSGFRVLLGHVEMPGIVNGFGVEIPAETWSWTEEDLRATGADFVALGHVHRRQRGYLGAAWHLNHGEERNPTGWLLLDTDHPELREFREVPGPRFRTKTPREFLEGPKSGSGETVRVLVTDPGELELLRGVSSPGVTIEDRTSRPEVATRGGQGLDPDGDPKVLLLQWLDSLPAPHNALSSSGSRERLAQLAEEVASLTGEGGQSVPGSLTEVHRVRVRGFGPHVDTSVDFPSGWSALTGPTGSGKTFLLEALFATLDGEWVHPRRSSFLATVTSPDGLGVLEAEFSAAGHRWKLVRTVRIQGRGSDHQIELFQVCPDGGVVLAAKGTPRSGIQGTVEKLVGSRRIRVGAILLSQKAVGDLVSSTEGDRMGYLNEFLGLERFGLLEEAARTKSKTLREKVSILSTQTEGLDRLRDSLPGLRANAARNGFSVSILQAEVQTESQSVEASEVRNRNLVTERENRNRLTQTRERLVRDRVRTLEDLERTRTRAEKYLEAILKGRDPSSEIVILEKKIHDRNQKILVLRTASTELRQVRIRIGDQRDLIRSWISGIDLEIRKAEEQERFLEQVGCRSKGFLPCPLIDSTREAIKTLPDLRSRREALERTLLEESDPVLDGLLREERDLIEQTSGIDLLEAAHQEDVDRIRMLRNQVSERVRNEANLLRDREEIERLSRDLVRVDRDLQENGEALLGIPEDLPERVAAADRDLEEARGRRDSARNRLEVALREHGASIREAETVETRVLELERIESELRSLERDLGLLGVLVQGWGRTGVPQLLISQDLPNIQKVVDEVCEVDFRGRYSLTLSTLRAKRDGGQKESFSLLFRSPKGHTFDASESSGGEEAALRAVLRCAQIVYRIIKSSDGYGTCLMDEPTAGQDREVAEATIGMISRLRDRFRQVIIVSHDEELLANIPHQIRPFWAGGIP